MASNNVTVPTIWNTTTAGYETPMEDYIEYQISWKMFQVYVPICCLVGLFGNITSFLVLVLSQLKNTSTCIYMATIACLDTMILSVVLVYHVSRYPGTRVFHTWTCSFVTFMFYFTIHFDTLVILAMTFERYIVVKFPLKAASITRKKTILVITAIGIFSFALNSHSFFTRKMDIVYGVERCAYDSEMDKFFVTKIYPWIDTTIYCFIPLSSLFVLNILIIYQLRKASKAQKTLTGVQHGNVKSGRGLGEKRAQTQVTLMLVLVSVTFLLLTGPISILLLVQRYAWIPVTPYDRALNWLAHGIADNLMYTNHAINFILYLLSGQRFRRELKKIICVRGKLYRPSSSNQGHTSVSDVHQTVTESLGTGSIAMEGT